MSSTRSLVLGVAAIGTALAAPAATADSIAPLYAKMKQSFTVAKAAKPTGWKLDAALKPTPQGQQVPPQRSVVFAFPAGTTIDGRAVPRCTAKDGDIQILGAAACPTRSRIGSGSATIFLGGSTIPAKLQVFAGGSRLILRLTTTDGTGLRVLSGTINGSRVTATIPSLEVGGYETAITTFALNLNKAGTARKPLLRTPKTCPRSGRWTFTYLPRYDAPYLVQKSTSTMACRR